MTLAFRLDGGFASPSTLDRGLSDDARHISRIAKEATDPEINIALSGSRRAAREALMKAFTHAQEGGWDGYGASPADPTALMYSIQLLGHLPTTVPSPEVSVDSDGDIAFEWDRGLRRIFSVRIGRDGTLHYAGLVGHSTFHGIEILREGIPTAIADGIDRVIRASDF